MFIHWAKPNVILSKNVLAIIILFYYLGGVAGINTSGFVYAFSGWPGIIAMGTLMLLIPVGAGLIEIKKARREAVLE